MLCASLRLPRSEPSRSRCHEGSWRDVGRLRAYTVQAAGLLVGTLTVRVPTGYPMGRFPVKSSGYGEPVERPRPFGSHMRPFGLHDSCALLTTATESRLPSASRPGGPESVRPSRPPDSRSLCNLGVLFTVRVHMRPNWRAARPHMVANAHLTCELPPSATDGPKLPPACVWPGSRWATLASMRLRRI